MEKPSSRNQELMDFISRYVGLAAAAGIPAKLLSQRIRDMQSKGWWDEAAANTVSSMTPPSDPTRLAEWGMQFTPLAAGTMVRNIGRSPVQALSKEVPSSDVLRKKFLELMEAGKSQNRGLLEKAKLDELSAAEGRKAAEEAFLKDRAWKAKLNDLEIHYGSKRLD